MYSGISCGITSASYGVESRAGQCELQGQPGAARCVSKSMQSVHDVPYLNRKVSA
jgi:hypothetical protein